MKQLDLWPNNSGQGHRLLAICVCALLSSLWTSQLLAQGMQPSAAPSKSSVEQGKGPESKPPVKPQQDPPPAQSSSQKSKSEGENGAEKHDATKKTVSSQILAVKLALLGDPRLFPYEIEVEAGSDEVTLVGKVSTETEKAAAAKIASTVPAVKSVINKLEVNKELAEIFARKQDDIITHYVKEQFAKSATVKAAGFEVKTEQGVVSLSGTVRFQVIVLEAAEAARQVPGVKAVKTDHIEIASEG